jgi:hypothetical protein
MSPRWWICDKDGNVSVAQWPNPALVLWLVTLVLGWTRLLGPDRAAALDAVGAGALVAWALDEVVRGTSPVRRVLGAVVLAVQLVRLFG